MNTYQEAIEIINAKKEQKPVEFRSNFAGDNAEWQEWKRSGWVKQDGSPLGLCDLDFSNFEFRLKPDKLSDLKPCPFCGGPAQLTKLAGPWFRANCTVCYAAPIWLHSLKEDAVRSWNVRHMGI